MYFNIIKLYNSLKFKSNQVIKPGLWHLHEKIIKLICLIYFISQIINFWITKKQSELNKNSNNNNN